MDWGKIGSVAGMIGGGLIGGPVGLAAGGALGGGVGGLFDNRNAQQEANVANANMAAANRDWQKEMSNTAHQREVADLKAAGLNPLLSAGGNGSSTPAGNVATMQAPQIDMPSLISMFTNVVSLGQNQQKLDLEKEKTGVGITKTRADKELTEVKTRLSQKGMIRADLEGETSSVLKNALEFLKTQFNKNNPPKKESYKDKYMKDFNKRMQNQKSIQLQPRN